ncbi:FAD-binding and (Fe-S)-binding domain-containing protein [Opacimonas viscosa]|uniref:D-lactate dehydrogenase (cytochrome) n=1 Tax=Opacimonas viscosa TaxID=2961944 RepID=A0AA41WXL4_9ALTE|nr:FAD-binding and (Fe-S)-binding domain-containing protein [Opacimonas viscosa]MCP3428397.1 FAD-binding oxidoreductase [Opacimonas viscosa]
MHPQYLNSLSHILDNERIITDISRRRAYATDASFYQLIPALVIKVASIGEMQDVLALSFLHNIPVTFRAAGTSLSGQAITDSVLILLTEHWRNHEILENGQKIRLQPGVVGADANRYLAPYQRKIGPDPASINACKIGGIAANNASGMCCGVAKNTFYTMAEMTIIFADGTALNTGDASSIAAFRTSHKPLLDAIEALAQNVQADAELTTLIQHKYRLKNTTGYSLNALTDYTDPVSVLSHLMVGSEGTLGFIADITYNTVVEHPYKATGLYLFANPTIACQLASTLREYPVDAVELLDQRALNSVAGKPGLPDTFCHNAPTSTALLIETTASDQASLDAHISQLTSLVQQAQPLEAIHFSQDAVLSAQLWAIRKATFPAVGAVRETGTTVIIEDVSFPHDVLDQGVLGLQALFAKYNYTEALIFGHALAGNLHFVFTQAFDTPEQVQRYDDFMRDVAQLVAVDFQGSLKAEHGTGRNMAPFVELEWGKKAFSVMRELKQIIDPTGILNPGVILNEDPDAHIKNLKALPKANDIVDKCIECGFCEPVCPSKDLTFTPRQRIAIWRRIQQLKDRGYLIDAERQELGQLEHDFQYYGIDTCAATGLCAERCPVGINTGDLIRELRGQNVGKFGTTIAKFSSEQFAPLTKTAGTALGLASRISKIIGPTRTNTLGRTLHHSTGRRMPLWFSRYPQPAAPLGTSKSASSQSLVAQTKLELEANHAESKKHTLEVIYFPSCASRTMGPDPLSKEQRSLHEVTQTVLHKAGYTVTIPASVSGLCCGMPFSSKGLSQFATAKGDELLASLQTLSDNGRIPIIFDTSPCKLRLAELGHALPIFEACEFMAQHALDKLDIQPINETVALHITCSSQKMGLSSALQTIAQRCATHVIEPEGIHCCGFAGDKGMTQPELNASALSTLKKQVGSSCSNGYSNSRTCEIGLSEHSGIDYQSLLYLLDRASTAKASA